MRMIVELSLGGLRFRHEYTPTRLVGVYRFVKGDRKGYAKRGGVLS